MKTTWLWTQRVFMYVCVCVHMYVCVRVEGGGVVCPNPFSFSSLFPTPSFFLSPPSSILNPSGLTRQVQKKERERVSYISGPVFKPSLWAFVLLIRDGCCLGLLNRTKVKYLCFKSICYPSHCGESIVAVNSEGASLLPQVWSLNDNWTKNRYMTRGEDVEVTQQLLP